MSDWDKVGSWLKKNGGQGVALVGSLLTGNVPGAIAAGAALVTSATGVGDPAEVLAQLQGNPESLVKLKELAYTNEADIRQNMRLVLEQELKDKQAEHHETQETIRGGDKAEDKLVRWTRPLMAWTGLLGGMIYVIAAAEPSETLLAMLFTAPWAYMGMRTADKIGAGFAKAGVK